LSPNGLRLALGYSHVYYELGQEFKDLDASGSADIFQGTFTYPLLRSSTQNLFLSLNLAHKAMGNKYAAFEVLKNTESTVGKLGLVYEVWTTLFGRPLFT
jgi:hemolysin activation/secretion protein